MEYNMRNIMISAHNRRRNFGITMSEALKMAWAAAKALRAPMDDAEFLYRMQDSHTNAEAAAHYYNVA